MMAEIILTVLVAGICLIVARSMRDGYLPTPRWLRWLRVVALGGSRLHDPDSCPACLEQAAVDQNTAEAERVSAEKAKLEPATPAQQPATGAWEQPPVVQPYGPMNPHPIPSWKQPKEADTHERNVAREVLADLCDHDWIDDTRMMDAQRRLVCYRCGAVKRETRGHVHEYSPVEGEDVSALLGPTMVCTCGRVAPYPSHYGQPVEFGTGPKRKPRR